MSIQSQKKHMKEIGALLAQDLGYVQDQRNGAKKQFLSKSAAFLRALGKELGFSEFKVNTNPGGIAVSGEVTLYGVWSDGNGVSFQLAQSCGAPFDLLYRSISHIKDYRGGQNQWLRLDIFNNQEYECLCEILLKFNKTDARQSDGVVA